MKGHGYSSDLLAECIRDARAQGREGICILSAEGRKREFLSDPKYLANKGFTVADTSDCGITLMYLPLTPSAEKPTFKECARHPEIKEDGFVLYYTDQCPFTYYWVPRVAEAAAEHGIPLKTVRIADKETARNLPAPVTTYALFRDGKFVTHAIQSDKKFLALAGVKGRHLSRVFRFTMYFFVNELTCTQREQACHWLYFHWVPVLHSSDAVRNG